MAEVVDSTQQFTIALIQPVQEGFGTIISFTADKTQAAPGEDITISYTLRNDGAATDDLFARLTEGSTPPLIRGYTAIPAGITVSDSVTLSMPDRNLTITLEAGHIE